MTTDNPVSDWFTTEEPPERLEQLIDTTGTTDNDWFSDQPFAPTPVGEEPKPNLDFEPRWNRREATEEVDVSVTATHGDGAVGTTDASTAGSESTKQASSPGTGTAIDQPSASGDTTAGSSAEKTDPAPVDTETAPEQTGDAEGPGPTVTTNTDDTEATRDNGQSGPAGTDTAETGGILSRLKTIYTETLKFLAGK